MEHADVSRLQNAEVLAAITAHEEMTPDAFVLAHAKQRDWPLAAMAEQIACRKKLAQKLPDWQGHNVLLSATAYEQASSQWTARAKQQFLNDHDESITTILDVCGGLGVDLMAHAHADMELHYNDIDPLKSALFAWNCQQLSCDIATVRTLPAHELLQSANNDAYDLIMADPSRRSAVGKRSMSLAACEPNVLELLELMRSKARYLLLKLAPSLGHQSLCEQIPGVVQSICVSLNGENKERLLFVDLHETAYASVAQSAWCLNRSGSRRLFAEKAGAVDITAAARAQRYIYEPDPAIIQAALSSSLLQDYPAQLYSTSHADITKANALLFTSDTYYQDYPGRAFQCIHQMPLQRKQVRRYLRDQQIERAHVWRCQVPQSVKALRALLGLADGPQASCLIAQDMQGKQQFVHCEPIAEASEE